MSDTEETIVHYASGNVREAMFAALRAAGHDPARLRAEDTNEADHLHLGGKHTTAWIADTLALDDGARLLDVGSGMGGPARYFAGRGATVTGVDVTAEFVDLATELNRACGLDGALTMLNRPGQDTGLPEGSFDAALMLHVGMNIADKAPVFAEVFRLLRPGGVFGVYDLMGTNELTFPMPWSITRECSHVESETAYRGYLEGAGFDVQRSMEHRDEVLARAALMLQQGGAPLSGALILGEDVVLRRQHSIEAVRDRQVTPTLLISRKPE